jgi:hydrogenase maturation protein HypF
VSVDLREDVRDTETRRIRVAVLGMVQGVGYRPFIYRLASEMGVGGWICNCASGVVIEAESSGATVARFLHRIRDEKPLNAIVEETELTPIAPIGENSFEIRASDDKGVTTTPILPDIATCQDCRREIFDANDRRFRYPFTNCTNCGPRFSIVTSLPYDRPNTSMTEFDMCDRCRAEYVDPHDRRFHAQANACPDCGPSLRLLDRGGEVVAVEDRGLREAAKALRQGAVVAVKGMGGFHLMVNALDDGAVRTLRDRKRRDAKPLALMLPSLDSVREHCQLSRLEKQLLASPEAPIVLLRRRAPGTVAPSVALDNPYLGVMLPYTPLHHLLMAQLGVPVVATSGNLSDERICADGREALAGLGSVADLFVDHDRPIVSPVDDSVVCVMAGKAAVMRRARGYAPAPFAVLRPDSRSVRALAVGAHLKNTIAVLFDGRAFVSQHIGDLSSASTVRSFEHAIERFVSLYGFHPDRVVCDMHPDYQSTSYAESLGRPLTRVQHHHAHVLACMTEHSIDDPVLGICWDGTGYGPDGTVWGGEFLRTSGADFERIGHFKTFAMPGGETAVREPRRSAIGLLHEVFGERVWERRGMYPLGEFSEPERRIIRAAVEKGLNTARTSSAGRLFDAVASLLGICHRSAYEGQAAMELEFAADGHETDSRYPFEIESEGGPVLVIDWRPMIHAILRDTKAAVPVGQISAGFHNTLVDVIVRVSKLCGESRVVLTGGCFQNRLLTEHAIYELEREGFTPYWHERVPPNDGGIALGQISAVSLRPEGSA